MPPAHPCGDAYRKVYVKVIFWLGDYDEITGEVSIYTLAFAHSN